MRVGRRTCPRRHYVRLCRGRTRRECPPGTTGRKGPPTRHADDRPELLRPLEYGSERPAECHIHVAVSTFWPCGDVLPKRSDWTCDAGRSTTLSYRNLVICQRRQ